MPESIIDVKNLTKKFNDVTAVDDISFSVTMGEIFGFLGPNGAGKTTTIRLLTGTLTPDEGAVSINGIDMLKNPVKAKSIMGIIPEMGNIYQDLTPMQNIVLAGKFYGMPRKELRQKASILLRQFELFERKSVPARTLSKGLKQRINIASALVHNPAILFLDEPMSGLDIQSQRLIRKLITYINSSGATVFLTTHNINEANLLCDRVGIINKGKIVAIDRPEVLRKAYEQTRSVEVSFQELIEITTEINTELINRAEKMGDKWKLYTGNPDSLVKFLCRFAEEKNLTINALEICRTSLEDVFVALTEKRD